MPLFIHSLVTPLTSSFLHGFNLRDAFFAGKYPTLKHLQPVKILIFILVGIFPNKIYMYTIFPFQWVLYVRGKVRLCSGYRIMV